MTKEKATALQVGLLGLALLFSKSTIAQSIDEAKKQEDETEVITVVSRILSGEFRDDFADSATKTYTHNLDIPQPVDVINQALIESQGSLEVSDVYRNSASVNVSDPLGHTNIRGFRLNENSGGILKNGLREVSQGFAFQPLANIEKIEVLKGVSSALYGRGEPGGIVNLITKKPLAKNFTKVSVTADSDSMYQLNLDANAKLSDKLLFRINVQYDEGESFRDVAERKRLFIAPSLSYQFNENQKLTVEAEFNDFTQTRDQGIAAINGDIRALPKETFLGGDTNIETQITTLQATHEWFINNDWALNTKFRIGKDDSKDALFNPLEESLQGALNTPTLFLDEEPRIYRTFTSADDVKDETNLDINLTGAINTSGIEHHVLFGLNTNTRKKDRKSQFNYNAQLYSVLASINPALSAYGLTSFVDPFNPQDAELITLPAGLGLLNPFFDQQFEFSDQVSFESVKSEITTTGIYFQDQVKFNDQWQVVLGARYDENTYELDSTKLNTALFFGGGQIATDPTITSDQSKGKFIPKAAVLYSPQDNMSIYASYGRQYDLALVASEVRPTESEAVEVGYKWEVTDDLSASFAYFNIEKTNIVDTGNLLEPDVIDEVVSEGFEVTLLGRVNPHWVVSANYSDFDAEITEDLNNPQNEGNRSRGTPTSSGSVWVQYQANENSDKGLSVALGLNYVGARPVDNANTFELPSYTLLDSTISYRVSEQFNVRLLLENLTDKDWFRGSYNSQSIFTGNGRRARLTVDYLF
jgi:iron complex outermembrane receptor protein